MAINKTKRLVADIPVEIHNEIKAQAAYKNISVQKYILQAVIEKMAREKKFQ